MTFQVTDAFREGFDDITSEQGALIVAVYVVLGLVNTVLSQTATESALRTVIRVYELPPDALQEAGGMGALAPLSLGLPLGVAVALFLVVAVIGLPVTIVTIRIFGSESPELLPADATDSLLKTTAILLATRVLAGIAVGIGTLLLVIPGLVLLVLFFFLEQEIALNDAGVVDAFRNSFDIVSENAVGVVILIVALFLLGFAVSIPVFFLSAVLPAGVGQVVSSLITSVVSVFGLATAVSAYQQAVSDDVETIEDEIVDSV